MNKALLWLIGVFYLAGYGAQRVLYFPLMGFKAGWLDADSRMPKKLQKLNLDNE